jgi:hypothetical protein
MVEHVLDVDKAPVRSWAGPFTKFEEWPGVAILGRAILPILNFKNHLFLS